MTAIEDVAMAPWPPRALVTGAAGFIGGHLVRELLLRGTEVVALDRRAADFSDIEPDARRRVNSVVSNLSDRRLAPILGGTDTVFHLAGVPGVGRSWGSDSSDFSDCAASNVLGTHRLIRACERAGVRRLVLGSSSEVYGPTIGRATEMDPIAPRSPYAATKLAAEQLCLAHARRDDTDLSVSVLRYFTVYGPRQRPDMAVHRILTSALTGAPFELHGDGTQRRDLTYVEDVVDATVAAAALPMTTSVINIGTGTSVELNEVVALAEDVTGRAVRVVPGPVPTGDLDAAAADLTVARAVLGYRPMVDLREGITRQAAWLAADLASPRPDVDDARARVGATT